MAGCARCQTPLSPSEHAGLEWCPSCGGHLVTPHAVMTVASRANVPLSVLGELAASGKPSVGCPACGTVMKAFSMKGATVDGCQACGHLWLDAGELAGVTRGAMPEPPRPQGAPSAASGAPAGRPRPMELMTGPEAWLGAFVGETSVFRIRQKMERLEVWTGLQARNQYTLESQDGMGVAVEEGTGAAAFLARQFMRTMAALRVTLHDARHNPMVELKRPFTWVPWLGSVTSVAVYGAQELGAVRQEFSLLGGRYTLLDSRGRAWATVTRNKLGMGWTFVLADPSGRPLGRIEKHWSGLLKEALSEADNLSLTLEGRAFSSAEKAVALCAALLMDFNHFERAPRRSGVMGLLSD